MGRQFFVKDYAQPKVTEEERKESRRQEGLSGVKLNNKKFYCEKKLTDTCQHFFHGRGKFGRCGVEDDGRRFIQIYTIDLDVKSQLAAKSSDGAFHKFLQACYDKICEIYEKRLATSKAAREADQDNSKRCEAELKQLQKEQSARSADRILLEQQKVKKTQPPFDKGDFKTWSSLSAEDAQESKDRLTEQKTGLLKKADDLEKQTQQFTTESDAFQKEVNALKCKLNAASDEKQYKDIRVSYDYNELQVQKLQKKIEEAEQQKSDIEAELKGLDREIEILECVLDNYQLTKDAENWQNRNERAVERIRKTLEDRDALDMLRTNLNSRWQKLTSDPEPEKKRISIFSQDKPIKPEEICQPLTLKADARNYFI